jgi:hypothetical protein
VRAQAPTTGRRTRLYYLPSRLMAEALLPEPGSRLCTYRDAHSRTMTNGDERRRTGGNGGLLSSARITCAIFENSNPHRSIAAAMVAINRPVTISGTSVRAARQVKTCSRVVCRGGGIAHFEEPQDLQHFWNQLASGGLPQSSLHKSRKTRPLSVVYASPA